MSQLILYLARDEIQKIVADMAKRISDDYKGKSPVFIGILKGSFIFLADLIRYLTIPAKIDFIRTSSYGNNSVSSGEVILTKDIEIDIKNRDVIIVEDVADTGVTLSYLIDYMGSKNPNSIKTCALLDKRGYRKIEIKLDYYGHYVSEGFLVGYGLDYAENYRYLSDIYDLKL
ncbi:MAG: hypoxanthine phosphoribosyltransferase [Deltaproteobacteria bacterium]|nr:hypoxanthine phosphoribosyltransferase [Deltaproteobacteria bacterium]